MDGQCGEKGVVYQASVTFDGTKTETYTGLTERKFLTDTRSISLIFKIDIEKIQQAQPG